MAQVILFYQKEFFKFNTDINSVKDTCIPLPLGLILGESIFTTTHYNHQLNAFFNLSKHITRLLDGASEIWDISTNKKENIRNEIILALSSFLNSHKSTTKNYSVRISLAIDSDQIIVHNSVEDMLKLFILFKELHQVPSKPGQKKLNLILDSSRMRTTIFSSNIKYGFYMQEKFLLRKAIKNGYDDILLCDQFGNIHESSANNFFLIKDDIIITPPLSSNVFDGIMRNTFINFALDNQKKIEIKKISFDEILNTDFAFLTNSVRGIQEISSITRNNLSIIFQNSKKTKVIKNLLLNFYKNMEKHCYEKTINNQ